jgi:UDPglucose 6-dehydrogenase
MKIAIIGYGFVGKALANGFKSNVELKKIDPKLNTQISELNNFNPDAVFICVPTPMLDDHGQDISVLMDVINELKSLNINSLVVLKSTVLPDNILRIKKLMKNIIYNPEFLREKHANSDFINSKLIVFGGNKKEAIKVGNIYKNFTKCKYTNYTYTDLIAASLIKYSINTFLATKVIFFNELKNLFDSSGSKDNWNNFIENISKDSRIGNSHMQVPGHDGRLGFGGACLPKDSSALINYADDKGVSLSLLKHVISTNNILRASYNTNTEREIEQNITFNGDETF